MPFIRSPLNYIGGKHRLLSQILPLFPIGINRFVDLFTGGGSIGINVSAGTVYLNDHVSPLIALYSFLKETPLKEILEHIQIRIKEFALSKQSEKGYRELRALYNTGKHPLDLFVLSAFSFNHQIRFNNNSGEFNVSYGKDKCFYNLTMEHNLSAFVKKLQTGNFILSSLEFDEFDYSILHEGDFIYCDPPYLVSDCVYNDGKHGFRRWGEHEEVTLLAILKQLTERGIRFALSNVLRHKGDANTILIDWLDNNPQFNVHRMRVDYSGCSYQLKIKGYTEEVLVVNYPTSAPVRKMRIENRLLPTNS